jgi:peroxiredoxin Q/BCP
MADVLLQEGDAAPDVQLADDHGNPFHLAALRGQNVVLYFYPKADTPGCTIEACEFRAETEKFLAEDTVIVGISPDGSPEQAAFKNKFALPFTLLADVEHKAAEDYGVWKERMLDGKQIMAAERTTFLIDKAGVVRKIFRKVNPNGHAAAVYESLKALAA